MTTTARPVTAVLGAAVLFGTAGTAQALGPGDTTPLGVGAARIALATALLWAFVLLGRPGSPVALVRAHRTLVLAGGVGVTIYTPAFFAGVDFSAYWMFSPNVSAS